ncbi:DnaJ (Hsp40), sub A, member 4 [Linnemannia schmuckeri]|uniref:DnaJ (Hsp40), sub A, member 4 n=1 Tax=Linnemannia schmuckeri TaxID=64567 RepID=A0A9P5RLF8_9FUNG|nr:DnaJ (Hsp40), sub A, member 4 [Linnemannia schmuckeri]
MFRGTGGLFGFGMDGFRVGTPDGRLSNSGSSMKRSLRGNDFVHQLGVTFEKLCKGAIKPATLQKNILCAGCDGKGGRPEGITACQDCKGQGIKVISVIRDPGQRSGCKTSAVRVSNSEGTFIRDKDRASGTGCGARRCDSQAEAENSSSVFERRGPRVKISLKEAFCGVNKILLVRLDGRGILAEHSRGVAIHPGQVECIVQEGMPLLMRPSERGGLFTQFDIEFQGDHWINDRKLRILEDILPSTESILVELELMSKYDIGDATSEDQE